MGCNFKLIRESLTEKITGKQKPRCEGASHLAVRPKSLPGRRDTSEDPEAGQEVPYIFAKWQGSQCGWSEVARGAGAGLGGLLSTGCVEPST